MTASRSLATTINQVADETVGTSYGCLMIFANNINKEEIYFPFERDQQTHAYQDNVTVNYTHAVPDICTDPVWDFGDGHITTEPNPTHAYTETGKYEVTLRADCKANFGHRQEEEVTAAIYVSKVDMDVREHHHHENRITPDDPRTDPTAQNNLLVWHNADNLSISIDLIKPDKNSVFWIEVSKPLSSQRWNDIFRKITQEITPKWSSKRSFVSRTT